MPAVRQSVRLTRAMPLLISLKLWLEQTLLQVSVKSGIAKAIKYSLAHWQALTRYCEDVDRFKSVTTSAIKLSLRVLVSHFRKKIVPVQ